MRTWPAFVLTLALGWSAQAQAPAKVDEVMEQSRGGREAHV
jgi:hypothetical protein